MTHEESRFFQYGCIDFEDIKEGLNRTDFVEYQPEVNRQKAILQVSEAKGNEFTSHTSSASTTIVEKHGHMFFLPSGCGDLMPEASSKTKLDFPRNNFVQKRETSERSKAALKQRITSIWQTLYQILNCIAL